MRLALLLVPLMVSACDSGSAPPANAEAAAPSESVAEGLRPGRYAVSIMPQYLGDATPRTVVPQNYETCLASNSPESLEDFFLASDPGCSAEMLRIEDGEIFARTVCNFGSAPITTELRGSYDADGAELVGDVAYPEGTIRVNRSVKRLGDC